jgi:hypothetical protein
MTSSTSPTYRKKSGSIVNPTIPSSPSSMNSNGINNNNNNNNTNTTQSVAVFNSHYLQLGLLLIVVSVLFIDGIAILSHSNLFETNTNRHLRQQQQQQQQQEEEEQSRNIETERQAQPVSTEESYFKVPTSSSIVNEPKIAWLMSFPNSGTSYTSQLVRDTTFTVSASNYADETPLGLEGFLEPVYEDQIQGPFWIRPEDTPVEYEEPTKYILTKVRKTGNIQKTLCVKFSNVQSLYVSHVKNRHIVECAAPCVHQKSIRNHRTVSDVGV